MIIFEDQISLVNVTSLHKDSLMFEPGSSFSPFSLFESVMTQGFDHFLDALTSTRGHFLGTKQIMCRQIQWSSDTTYVNFLHNAQITLQFLMISNYLA